MNLLDHIPVVFDFPKKGIGFRDISPLLAHPEAFELATQKMAALFPVTDISHIAGIESRGFIFGVAMARLLGKPFVMVRKANKLPPQTFRISYDLEYGEDHLEIRKNILSSNDRVLLVDDVLATGGTALAAAQLIQMSGAQPVGLAVLLEISPLNGAPRCLNEGLIARAAIRVD
jgi:adenine phosphoribosyltransferase